MMMRDRMAELVGYMLVGLALCLECLVLVFLVWALARHVGWEDAIAIVVAGALILRALAKGARGRDS